MITFGGIVIMCAYSALVSIIVFHNPESLELSREVLCESMMIA